MQSRVRFNRAPDRVPEKVLEKVWEALVWRHMSGSTGSAGFPALGFADL